MRRVACIVVIALASSGCIGSTTSSTPDRSVSPVPRSSAAKADLTITYTAPKCPTGAYCVRSRGGGNFYFVRRHLTCSPAAGDYEDPGAVCGAVTDIVNKLEANPTASAICDCLMQLNPPRAVGSFDGKRRTIPLDGCSLCQLPGIGADLELLLPGPHG
jgi:hypothetical protein